MFFERHPLDDSKPSVLSNVCTFFCVLGFAATMIILGYVLGGLL